MRLLLLHITLLVVCMMVSCKPSVPNEYLQPSEMEDILYNYHLAQGIQRTAASGGEAEVSQRAYKLAVLKKYGVTEAQFESSLEYYMRHTERLHDIYENIAERLEREAMTQGASTSDLNAFDVMNAKGDTVDIWTDDRAFVLPPYPPYNMKSFLMKADTAFHKGDRFQLDFNTRFIVQEGSRNGFAVLAVKFGNDSIASQMQNVSTNMHYTLQISDTQRLGIKEVKGYLMFSQGQSSNNSMLFAIVISLKAYKVKT